MDVIIKKYGTTYALWFRESRSFLLLEEPAFDVFNMQQKKMERHEIVEFCRASYGHIEHNIEDFVDEVSGLLSRCNMPEAKQKLSQKEHFDDTVEAVNILESAVYKIGNKKIRINYGHKNLFHAIHPLQAHLAISESKEADNVIDCFVEEDILICKYNGKLVEAFKTEAVEYFTGNVRQLQYSIVFDKGFYNWMAMLHASGITNGKEAILFSAAAGSGKTTISALLKAHGYGYLSDDFIAADYQGKVYPFPAAISVKAGSVEVLSEYFPEIASTRPEQTFIGKMVRYIPVHNLDEASIRGFPVKAFVFVKYTAEEDFLFEPVEKREALQLLLQETWVNPQEQHVRRFFDWVEQTAFYRLNYGATPEAVEAVKDLFG
jgi:hypothetical protein